jgi:hypothetical protein
MKVEGGPNGGAKGDAHQYSTVKRSPRITQPQESPNTHSPLQLPDYLPDAPTLQESGVSKNQPEPIAFTTFGKVEPTPFTNNHRSLSPLTSPLPSSSQPSPSPLPSPSPSPLQSPSPSALPRVSDPAFEKAIAKDRELLDILRELLSEIPLHVPALDPEEMQLPYDFSQISPSVEETKKFGHAKAVIRLLNGQFHGPNVVESPSEIIFRANRSPLIGILPILEKHFMLAPGDQLLREYVEELIECCKGEIHEDMQARLRGPTSKGEEPISGSTVELFSSADEGESVVPPTRTPKPSFRETITRSQQVCPRQVVKEPHCEKTSTSEGESPGPSSQSGKKAANTPENDIQATASRPKPKMIIKPAGTEHRNSDTLTHDQEEEDWFQRNLHRSRYTSPKKVGKKKDPDAAQEPKPSRSDIRPTSGKGSGLTSNLLGYVNKKLSKQEKMAACAYYGPIMLSNILKGLSLQ